MTIAANGARASAAPLPKEVKELRSAWAAVAAAQREQRRDENEPYEVELPGFPPVLALRLPLRTLVSTGRIPDALTPYVLALMTSRNQEGGSAKFVVETQSQMRDLMDAAWLACVVEPPFTANDEPEDDAIPLRDVPLAAKDALLTWALGVDQAVRSFRRSGDAGRGGSDRDAVPAGPADDRGNRPGDGAVAGLPIPPVRVLRGHAGRSAAARDAGGADAGPGPSAKGDALVDGAEMDLGASDRTSAAAARRGARGAKRRDVA